MSPRVWIGLPTPALLLARPWVMVTTPVSGETAESVETWGMTATGTGAAGSILMHSCVRWYCLPCESLVHSCPCLENYPLKTCGHPILGMCGKTSSIFMKLAATVEQRIIKGCLLTLVEERIQEPEKKGLLPKGK